MTIDLSILNETKFIELKSNAALYIPTERRKVFDVYTYFSSNPRKLNSVDDLISAISIAYSWMPTMLDILDHDEESLKELVKEIPLLGSIKRPDEMTKNNQAIKGIIAKLARATNNSVIGASKVLHLFYPINIPIFDSRVIRGWNHLFPIEMKIPALSKSNQVDSYIKYWFALLYWRENLSKMTIRELEKPLFDYGGYLKPKKKQVTVQDK